MVNSHSEEIKCQQLNFIIYNLADRINHNLNKSLRKINCYSRARQLAGIQDALIFQNNMRNALSFILLQKKEPKKNTFPCSQTPVWERNIKS